MHWEQRLDTERRLRRAIKRLRDRELTPGDGVAIFYLRIARAAVRYDRTFDQQLALNEGRRR